MAENAWIRILDVMYEEMMVLQVDAGEAAIDFELPRHSDTDSVTLLSQLTDYDRDTIDQELRALTAAGLTTEMGENTYGLTETGVRVAHERQQNRQNQDTQRILSYLTGVLAVSATGQFIIGVKQIQPTSAIISYVLIGYIIFLLGVLILIRSRFSA